MAPHTDENPMQHSGEIVLDAPAKVNLYLEILGRRADGFHELETLMLAVDLCDTLRFSHSDNLSMSCDVAGLSVGPDNLVLKAAEMLRRESGRSAGATIHLTKRIPWAAGLGGGSSDAATALVGLNRLWGTGLSEADLTTLASRLGSDVGFFVGSRAAWCTGRGEIIETVPVPKDLNLVLISPGFGLNTADVYRRLQPPSSPRSGETIRDAFLRGGVEDLGREMFNRLTSPALELRPELGDWLDELKSRNAAGALMSGSGSTIFALCRTASEAETLSAELTAESMPRISDARGRTTAGIRALPVRNLN